MALDRQRTHEIVQALLRAKNRGAGFGTFGNAGQTNAASGNGTYDASRKTRYADAGGIEVWPTPGLGPIFMPKGTAKGIWEGIFPPYCAPSGGALAFPPFEKKGEAGGGALDPDCDEQWTDARDICEKELSKPFPNRRMIGRYLNVDDCAKGLVSEQCGGNPVGRR